jgi:predicted nucleic acid-binding protein
MVNHGNVTTSTRSKIFLDMNILVYAVDRGQPLKRAINRLTTFDRNQVRGVISTQVMQEFYVVATRKLGIEPLMAKGLLNDFSRFELIQVQQAHIKEAIDCSVLNQLSFWDALILVSAESGECESLWTKDLNHGQVIRGVRIENPFQGA